MKRHFLANDLEDLAEFVERYRPDLRVSLLTLPASSIRKRTVMRPCAAGERRIDELIAALRDAACLLRRGADA